MPFSNITKPMQFGVLAASLSAGATSLTLVTGQGARFDAVPAGTVVDLIIADYNTSQNANFNRFECVQGTLLAGDTWTIVRAQEGTSALAFPIVGTDNPALVKVYLADTPGNMRRMIQGQGAVVQAAAPTLTSESPETIILTPAAPITVTLPTANVWAGRRFKFINLGALANTITVNASGGGNVEVIPGGFNSEIIAYKDTPTLGTDWGPPSTYLPTAKIDSLALNAITTANVTETGGAAGATPAAGKALFGALTTDGLGVAKSAFYALNEAGYRVEAGGGAAKNVSVTALDIGFSFVSAGGLGGTANTPSTIPFGTLKGGSLNAPKRGFRAFLQFQLSWASGTISYNIQFAGTNLTNTLSTGGSLTWIATLWVEYVDATHINYGLFGASAAGITTGSPVTVSGFGTALTTTGLNVAVNTLTADQTLNLVTSNVFTGNGLVFSALCEQVG